MGYFRTFGCIAHIKVTRPNLKKLDDRSIRTVFIGYEHGKSKAWRVYDPVSKRVHISRDAVFDEAASWNWEREGSGSSFIIEPTVTTHWLPDTGASRAAAPADGRSGSSSPATPGNSPSTSAFSEPDEDGVEQELNNGVPSPQGYTDTTAAPP